MTRWAAGLAALALSAAVHASGMLMFSLPLKVQTKGASQGEAALLGHAFEDLAVGAVPVVASPQSQPEHAMQQPVAQSGTRQVDSRLTLPPVPAEPTAISPVSSGPMPDLPPAKTASAADRAVDSALSAQVQTTHRATASAAPVPAVAAASSIRLQARPVAPKTAAALREPPPDPRARPSARPAAAARPAGNAAVEARKGGAEGSERAATAGPGGASSVASQPGNAAADNFPGQVLRKITALRKPAAPARGTVVVAFRIDRSGALAAATVVRSSGSSELDRIALDHIRRAAPFPAPPNGARTSYTFEFVGRP